MSDYFISRLVHFPLVKEDYYEYGIIGMKIGTDLALSTSVVHAFNNLKVTTDPSAMEIIREIVNLHREFAQNEARNLFHHTIHWERSEEEADIDNDPISVGERRSIEHWIHQVTAVYDHNNLRELHAKLFIIGLVSKVDQ
jgi:hypothetical protein